MNTEETQREFPYGYLQTKTHAKIDWGDFPDIKENLFSADPTGRESITSKLAQNFQLKMNEMLAKAMVARDDFDPTHFRIGHKTHLEANKAWAEFYVMHKDDLMSDTDLDSDAEIKRNT